MIPQAPGAPGVLRADAPGTPVDLYALSDQGLRDFVGATGAPPFRARQVRAWLYERGATSFDAMTDLPRALRAHLSSGAVLGGMEVSAERTSRDGTVKQLLRLVDGAEIEAVLMPYEDGRRTACISTQAGCAMGCVFCATGQMGLSRHLTEAEVFGQAARFSAALRQRGERLSNVVLMGMGEPLHNYDAAVGAMRRIQADLGIGARHITVSTVGIVPGIDRLAEEGLQVTLAVSLHAATDAERDALLPVNRRWPLADLIAACRRYAVRTGRRISFEWALIAGRTDGAAQATALADLLGDLPAHVNCIPLNPTRGYDGGPSTVAEPFLDVLRRRGVPATVRVRRGIDIEAGCGQLQAEVRRRRGGAA